MRDKIEKKLLKNKDTKVIRTIKRIGRKVLNYFNRNKRSGTIINENIFFIHNPKVAGSSINYAFVGQMNDLNSLSIRKIKKMKSFAFVRNPYTRVVSLYLQQIKAKAERQKGFIDGMAGYLWNYKEKFYPNMPFKEFVKLICSIPDKDANAHFKSQTTILMDKKGFITPNVGKFENLEEDFKRICKKLGVKNIPKLPKKNVTKKEKINYYDEETRKLVKERYKKDFEVFGY